MKSKIPTDAFDRYVAMGESRSYQAMAEVVGVSKCAIAKCAKREGWPERLAKIKADAREISDRKLDENPRCSPSAPRPLAPENEWWLPKTNPLTNLSR